VYIIEVKNIFDEARYNFLLRY